MRISEGEKVTIKYEPLVDSKGKPVIDATTGKPMVDKRGNPTKIAVR